MKKRKETLIIKKLLRKNDYYFSTIFQLDFGTGIFGFSSPLIG